MMKIQLLLLVLTCSLNITAQQTTQFWNNYSFYNPALNIDNVRQHASVTYKNLMTGSFAESNNFLVNYNYAINKHHAIGVNYGTTFFNRTNIDYSSNTADINYSYRIQFKDSTNHWLSFGAGLGLNSNKTVIGNEQPTNPIAGQTIKSTLPTLNLGVAYRFKNFMIGAGVRNLTNFGASNTKFINNSLSLYLMSSYDFRVTENFHLKPQLFIASEIGGNLLATIYKNYSIGFGFSNGHVDTGVYPISFIAQVDFLNKFRVGYSFDYATSTYVGPALNSHEIVLGFRLK